jgi:hypothetical protein
MRTTYVNVSYLPATEPNHGRNFLGPKCIASLHTAYFGTESEILFKSLTSVKWDGVQAELQGFNPRQGKVFLFSIRSTLL